MKTGKTFAAPQQTIGPLDAKTAARVLAAAADIALILDPADVVRDVAFRSTELQDDLAHAEDWRGQPFVETMTVESRSKFTALLEAARSSGEPMLRHLNHPGEGGTDVAVQYTAVQAKRDGTVVAFGRDLRPLSALQQRLIDAQQTLERDYARLREAQTRYRLLFEFSPEPLMVLDSTNLRITEVNAAGRLLLPESRGRGRASAAEKRGRQAAAGFVELFETRSREAVQQYLAGVQSGTSSTGSPDTNGAAPRTETMRVRLLDGNREVGLSAMMLREDEASLLLVRLSSAAPGTEANALNQQVLAALRQSPDGLVFTDAAGQVLSANAAFLDIAQLGDLEQAVGRSLDDWLGRPGVDLDVLLANVRQRGSVRLFATELRGERGARVEVEISAVAITGEGRTACCLSIRDVGRRLSAPEPRGTPGGIDLPRSPEQLTELIGRVSLKELVRDATDVIEKLCIEAALELTDDNRASAADMLGLSRQSLYVKLRRFGLGDLGEAEE